MQQRGVHDKDINLNLNYLLFQLMHLASNLDNEANQKEMLQFISAQSFREGISRGNRQHLFRFAREYAGYLSLLRKNISTDILDSIDKEIQEHYSENLDVAGLGQKILYQQCILRANLPQKNTDSPLKAICVLTVLTKHATSYCTQTSRSAALPKMWGIKMWIISFANLSS